MKSIFTTLIITMYTLITFGQQLTLEEWDQQAKTNIRLLPKYGYAVKSEAQKKADQEFIEMALKRENSHRKASDKMIQLGFQYLYQDITKAMYRFNQAYFSTLPTQIFIGAMQEYI
jgi:hypothetical protein